MHSPSVAGCRSQENTPYKAACCHFLGPVETGSHKITQKYVYKDETCCNSNKNGGQYLFKMSQQKLHCFIHTILPLFSGTRVTSRAERGLLCGMMTAAESAPRGLFTGNHQKGGAPGPSLRYSIILAYLQLIL